MRYTYTCMTAYVERGVRDDIRGDVFTRAELLTEGMVQRNNYINVYDNLRNREVAKLQTPDELGEWLEKLARDEAWGAPKTPLVDPVRVELHELEEEPKKDHINPSHYQGYLVLENEILQWLETMQYLDRYRDPEVFKGAVELQARKYIDRLGGKDAEPQEILKAVWYLKFLAAYIENGGPIRVKDIEKILTRKR